VGSAQHHHFGSLPAGGNSSLAYENTLWEKKKVVSSSNGPNMCGSILSFPVTKSTAMIN
jgi:hypothetical protein